MKKQDLSDGNYLCRIVVQEHDSEEVTRWVHFEVKGGIIPSDDQFINCLAERYNYSTTEKFQIKGVSVMLDEESGQFPSLIDI